MRRYFPDEEGVETKTIRTGKMAAQICHGSMAFLLKKLDSLRFSESELEWLNTGTTKVVVYVDTEKELLEVYNKAKKAGLITNLITDSGKTEFKNIPTNTVVAIGPDFSEKFIGITDHLKLM